MPILVEDTTLGLYDKYDIVTEAYYGRPKEFVQAEELLKPIITAINYEYHIDNAPPAPGPLNGVDINYCKETRMIEALFRKVLKVGEFNITWYGARPMMPSLKMDGSLNAKSIGFNRENAFNIPSTFAKFKHVGGRNTYMLTDVAVHVFLDKGLIYQYQLTPEEIMGVILHETGHALNFSVFSILSHVIPSYGEVKELSQQVDGYALIPILVGRTIFGGIVQEILPRVLAEIDKFVDSFLHQTKIGKFSVITIQTFQQAVSIFSNLKLLNSLANGGSISPALIASNYLNPRHIFGYSDEKYADSFATAYGYGVGCASFMKKFQYGNSQINIRNIPVANVVYDLYRCTMGTLLGVVYFDEHPKDATRVYSQLKKLRRDLKDPSVPKELAAEMEEQIARLEQICEQMTSVRENAKDGMIFTAICNKIIIKGLKGISDPREFFEFVWRHEE